jgi:hypothetical protein
MKLSGGANFRFASAGFISLMPHARLAEATIEYIRTASE